MYLEMSSRNIYIHRSFSPKNAPLRVTSLVRRCLLLARNYFWEHHRKFPHISTSTIHTLHIKLSGHTRFVLFFVALKAHHGPAPLPPSIYPLALSSAV